MSDDVDRVNQDIDLARTTYLALARMILVIHFHPHLNTDFVTDFWHTSFKTSF